MSWINVREAIPHYNNLYWILKTDFPDEEAIRICYYERKKKRFIDMHENSFYSLNEIDSWAPIEEDKFSLKKELTHSH